MDNIPHDIINSRVRVGIATGYRYEVFRELPLIEATVETTFDFQTLCATLEDNLDFQRRTGNRANIRFPSDVEEVRLHYAAGVSTEANLVRSWMLPSVEERETHDFVIWNDDDVRKIVPDIVAESRDGHCPLIIVRMNEDKMRLWYRTHHHQRLVRASGKFGDEVSTTAMDVQQVGQESEQSSGDYAETLSLSSDETLVEKQPVEEQFAQQQQHQQEPWDTPW